MAKETRLELVERIKREMASQINNGDAESAHSNADNILVEFITKLGYKEIADLYEAVEKWYA